jgi:hypothetical protein
MSTIFYSEVNKSVQKELIARGSAGTVNRTTAAIDYMVSKIANVQIDAYDTKPTVNSKAVPGFGTLGGSTVRAGAYMPSGQTGFLNDKLRPANRIPPIITELSIAINDQSKSYINKASVTILVPDATTDMDGEFGMEAIYCKPGRYIKISIAHPASALLTPGILEDDGLPSTDFLKTLYPNTDATSLRKLNELYFQGRITTFSYTYNSDGSLALTFEAIGTSNTYADIGVYINNKTSTTTTGEQPLNQVQSLYNSLSAEVDQIIKTYNEKKISDFEHLVANTTDQSILVGKPYLIGDSNQIDTKRMVSLGYLIQHINTKLTEAVGARIHCDDIVCKSNYYERLVSADSMQILLWRGKNDLLHDTYKFDLPASKRRKPSTTPDVSLQMFPNIKQADIKTAGFSVKSAKESYSLPSRIYIDLELIRSIITKIDKDPTIKPFLIELSKEIARNTGNAIIMSLIQHPTIADALIYYDTNFVTTGVQAYEFTLPVFATKTGASVVREFSLTSNVPNSVKNMVFGIDSMKTGTQRVTTYNPYIYADAETKKKLAEDWTYEHNQAVYQLAEKKEIKAQRPTDTQTILELEKILEKYVTYFTDDILKSIGTNKSIFPMELEFTIDGINGFKFGDVLNFNGLPKRYTDSFVFTILGIEHRVSNEGEWITTIKCNPRIRIKE